MIKNEIPNFLIATFPEKANKLPLSPKYMVSCQLTPWH